MEGLHFLPYLEPIPGPFLRHAVARSQLDQVRQSPLGGACRPAPTTSGPAVPQSPGPPVPAARG
eukprot:1111579-Alexandrium_andersonii.AAC.1